MTTSVELEAEKKCGVSPASSSLMARRAGARITGTGLDVFEVILSYRAAGEDWSQLTEGFHWLSDDQLRAAIRYYETYPDEVEAELDENTVYTPDHVYSRHPFVRRTAPPAERLLPIT